MQVLSAFMENYTFTGTERTNQLEKTLGQIASKTQDYLTFWAQLINLPLATNKMNTLEM